MSGAAEPEAAAKACRHLHAAQDLGADGSGGPWHGPSVHSQAGAVRLLLGMQHWDRALPALWSAPCDQERQLCPLGGGGCQAEPSPPGATSGGWVEGLRGRSELREARAEGTVGGGAGLAKGVRQQAWSRLGRGDWGLLTGLQGLGCVRGYSQARLWGRGILAHP